LGEHQILSEHHHVTDDKNDDSTEQSKPIINFKEKEKEKDKEKENRIDKDNVNQIDHSNMFLSSELKLTNNEITPNINTTTTNVLTNENNSKMTARPLPTIEEDKS